jgi:uncharacterized protein (TIGR03435 family)
MANSMTEKFRKACAYAVLVAFITASRGTWVAPCAFAQQTKNDNISKSQGHSEGKKDIHFEVVSIRPAGPGLPASMTNNPSPVGYNSATTLALMIQMAYATEDSSDWGSGPTKIINGPSWSGEFYVVNARVADADIAAWRNQSGNHELLRTAMRALLKERFKFQFHEQQTDIPVLQLVASKKSTKLKLADPSNTPKDGIKTRSGGIIKNKAMGNDAEYQFCNSTVRDVIDFMNRCRAGHIVDATGLAGRYDFTLQEFGRERIGTMECLDAFQIGKLGLGLKQGKGHGTNLIIDHVERPTPN